MKIYEAYFDVETFDWKTWVTTCSLITQDLGSVSRSQKGFFIMRISWWQCVFFYCPVANMHELEATLPYFIFFLHLGMDKQRNILLTNNHVWDLYIFHIFAGQFKCIFINYIFLLLFYFQWHFLLCVLKWEKFNKLRESNGKMYIGHDEMRLLSLTVFGEEFTFTNYNLHTIIHFLWEFRIDR